MPSRRWTFENRAVDIESMGPSLLWEPPDITLVPVNPFGNFTGTNDDSYKDYEDLILTPVAIGRLKEFWGAIAYGENTDNIKYQLTFDGGTTWVFWSGGNWVTAGPNDFSTIEEINEGVTAGIPGSRTIQVKLRFYSADGLIPSLEEFALFFELHLYSIEEDVKRSLRHHIQAKMQGNVPLRLKFILKVAGNDVLVETDMRISEVVNMYNVTQDPDRLIDVFGSISPEVPSDNPTTPNYRTITMDDSTITPQIGDVVEINLLGYAPVFLPVDSDYQISEIPAILILLGDGTENRMYRTADLMRETNIFKKEARVRPQPTKIEWPVRIQAISSDQVQTMAMEAALDQVFDAKTGVGILITSEANGEHFDFDLYQGFENLDAEKTGIFNRQASFQLAATRWIQEFTLVPLAEEIRLNTVIETPQGGISDG